MITLHDKIFKLLWDILWSTTHMKWIQYFMVPSIDDIRNHGVDRRHLWLHAHESWFDQHVINPCFFIRHWLHWIGKCMVILNWVNWHNGFYILPKIWSIGVRKDFAQAKYLILVSLAQHEKRQNSRILDIFDNVTAFFA